MVSISSKSEVFEFFFWGGGEKPLLGGVTFDLRCPFSNSDELFQSKVMCENLVGLDWLKSEACYFSGGGEMSPFSGVICDLQCPFPNFWPSYSSQKSCVKIWLG